MKCLITKNGFLVAVVAATASLPAQADLWSGFYKTSFSEETKPQHLEHKANCLSAILDAQERYQVPDNLLLSIGIQEAGRTVQGKITVWPWSVNSGGKGIFFKTREQAVGWVKTQQAQGVRSIDVGCMQINLFWHKDAFSSIEEAFDPTANARYAARFLTELKKSEGTWWRAAGSYHSRTEKHRQRYLASLVRNQEVANAQYKQLVASPRLDTLSTIAAPGPNLPEPPVLWGDESQSPDSFSIYSRSPLTPILPNYLEGGR